MIVFTVNLFVADRMHRVIVAADDKATAAKAVGMSKYAFKQKADVTTNYDEQGRALTKPGVPFCKPLDGTSSWRPM